VFNAVPYPAQVQRLQKSAIEEGQRARTHTLIMPPEFWVVEPGDVGTWTSARHGYVDKLFRCDGAIDKANLDASLSLTEVDPSDFDWDHATDFRPVTTGPTVIAYPKPQGIIDWNAEGYVLVDRDGIGRRAAIRLTWDGSLSGIIGVQYEIRLADNLSDVARGRTDQVTAGALIVSHNLIPDTDYEVRGQYIPSSPRDMLWSAWIDVTTPDARMSLADFDAAVKAQVTSIMDALDDKIDALTQKIASLEAELAARNWIDKRTVQSQLAARGDAALAQIDDVRTVAFDTEAAFATFSTAATAAFGSTTAFVGQTATAISTFDGYAAAEYAITLDVNGYATGFNLINGGIGTSAATFVVDKFQVASPGVAGGAPVPIFTVGNVGGTPKIGIRSDMYVDGSIAATKLSVGTLSAISANLGTIVTGKIQSASGKFVIDADNERIEIWS
jgi:hypothetical protein